jgi:spore coat polysaccharide biosynthesis protein SpsF
LMRVLGKSLLEFQIERLRRVKSADEIILATTTNDADQPLVDLSKQLSIPCYRGSENNVLSRYFEAARQHQADTVIRVTSDCPLIDPLVIDQVAQFYIRRANDYDYVSNVLKRTFPRGMDTEVFSFDTLRIAHEEAYSPHELEHVTPYIELHPERFRLGNVEYRSDQSFYRWTVDTMEDFDLVQKMIAELYPQKPEFTLEDCLACMAKYPAWVQINSHVRQKA